MAVSPDSGLRLFRMNADLVVEACTARVCCPTLVLNAVGDRLAPLEKGHRMVRMIRGAEIVDLPRNNHILLPETAAFERFFATVDPLFCEYNA